MICSRIGMREQVLTKLPENNNNKIQQSRHSFYKILGKVWIKTEKYL